jgi:hypothetical protein
MARTKPRLPVLLAIVVLFSGFASCTDPEPAESRNGDREEVAEKLIRGGKPPKPEIIREMETLWRAIAYRAEHGVYTIKTGELAVRAAEGDVAKLDNGYRKMVFGINSLVDTLKAAKAFFKKIREADPEQDLDSYQKIVALWVHDLFQARKLLPEKYASMVKSG